MISLECSLKTFCQITWCFASCHLFSLHTLLAECVVIFFQFCHCGVEYSRGPGRTCFVGKCAPIYFYLKMVSLGEREITELRSHPYSCTGRPLYKVNTGYVGSRGVAASPCIVVCLHTALHVRNSRKEPRMSVFMSCSYSQKNSN